MAITAKQVQELRAKTNVGMMECKKALVEAEGDMDKAIDILRERGVAAAAKKSSRIAADGLIMCYTDEDKKIGAIVEVNSETDFVASNDVFKTLVLIVAKTVAYNDPADIEALLDMTAYGDTRTVRELFQEAILKIGENLQARRFLRYEGNVATYIHGGGSVGVVVKFDVSDEIAATEAFKEMGKNVAMQICALSPAYLDRASVPADVIEHEKGIMIVQLQEDPKMKGKPANILDKIVVGKLDKFYSENCLLEQAYVKDGDIDVQKYIASVAKTLGSDIKVVSYVRYAKGEGIEKKHEDLAEEIAKQLQQHSGNA
ncbi:MAG: elongation factor Ts [Clostridia bacterium]|nr:elongation factor Ts [Clostridia bacterium]